MDVLTLVVIGCTAAFLCGCIVGFLYADYLERKKLRLLNIPDLSDSGF